MLGPSPKWGWLVRAIYVLAVVAFLAFIPLELFDATKAAGIPTLVASFVLHAVTMIAFMIIFVPGILRMTNLESGLRAMLPDGSQVSIRHAILHGRDDRPLPKTIFHVAIPDPRLVALRSIRSSPTQVSVASAVPKTDDSSTLATPPVQQISLASLCRPGAGAAMQPSVTLPTAVHESEQSTCATPASPSEWSHADHPALEGGSQPPEGLHHRDEQSSAFAL